MKRKLIQLSPSTGVVSLPSQWVKKNKLKKGMELDVQESENTLIVSTTSKKTLQEVTINTSKLSTKLVWAYVDAVYIAGYDSIIVQTKDQIQTQLLATIVRWFPGMILFEERNKQVHFKDITGDNKEDVSKILQRIYSMTIDMFDDALEAIKKKDWTILLEMKKRDYTINSYISYALRQLNKFGYSPYAKMGLMNTYIKLVEMFADKLSALLLAIGKEKKSCNTTLLAKYEESFKIMRSLHFKYSQETLLVLDELRKKTSFLIKKEKSYQLFFTELNNLLFDIEEVEMQLHL